MPIDREFEIKSGDIVKTPHQTLLAQLKTTYGGMTLREISYDQGIIENVRTSREWKKWLDDLFGRTGWTLYRRIEAVEWIALPRPMEGEL